MAQTSLLKSRCFLCRRILKREERKCINTAICPMSQRSVKKIVEKLVSTTKNVLLIQEEEIICVNCYEEFSDYDYKLIKLLEQQEKVLSLMQKAVVFGNLDDSDTEFLETATVSCIDETDLDETPDTSYKLKSTDSDTDCSTDGLPETQISKPKPYSCKLCEIDFTSKRALSNHIIQIHKKQHSCSICEYRHKNKYYVLLHRNVHTGRPANQCPLCDKKFARRTFLVQHIEGHFNTQKYQCEQCGLRFSEPKYLRRHTSNYHSEKQTCTICKQIFKTKRNLTRHMKLHEKDRPRFCCKLCNKSFSAHYTLKVHLGTHLEDVAEYQRKDKNYKVLDVNQSKLENVKIELLDPELSCIICKTTFVSKDQQNKHMQKKHDVVYT